AAGVDGNLAGAAGHLDRVERVLDLLLEANVADADRDRLQLRIGMQQADQEREDVVARGVGVDDQADRAQTASASLSSSCERVARPGTTPGCSTMYAPAAQPQRPASSACSAVPSGISSWTSRTSAAAIRGANASTCAGVSAASAPGTIAIRFCPPASTRIAAHIVGSATRSTADASTPSSRHSANAPSPNASSPTAVRSATSAPSRAAPIAWFEPLP